MMGAWSLCEFEQNQRSTPRCFQKIPWFYHGTCPKTIVAQQYFLINALTTFTKRIDGILDMCHGSTIEKQWYVNFSTMVNFKVSHYQHFMVLQSVTATVGLLFKAIIFTYHGIYMALPWYMFNNHSNTMLLFDNVLKYCKTYGTTMVFCTCILITPYITMIYCIFQSITASDTMEVCYYHSTFCKGNDSHISWY